MNTYLAIGAITTGISATIFFTANLADSNVWLASSISFAALSFVCFTLQSRPIKDLTGAGVVFASLSLLALIPWKIITDNAATTPTP